MNRSNIVWKCAGNFNNSFERIQTFFRRLSLVTKAGFMGTTLKLAAIAAMEEPRFASPKRLDKSGAN
jgi:hypothetical protein